MIRRPPRSTRTDTLFPYTTLFRSERVTVEDMQDAFERPISGRPVQEIERAAGTDPAFFQDTVIPAGAAGFLNAPGHADCLEALVQPPAGLPGLGDLDPRRAKPVDIADADMGFGQAFVRNVIAERSFRSEERRVGEECVSTCRSRL